MTPKKFVFDVIVNAVGYPIELIANLSKCRMKIDILIIDWQDSESINMIKFFVNDLPCNHKKYIKYLIHIGEKITTQYKSYNFNVQKEIFITRPFSLIEFKNMMNSLIYDHLPFLMIDDDYIFDCQNARIFSVHNGIDIKLSEKEIQILQHMLFSEYYTSSRANIGKLIWDFNYTVNTSTIETHIYKLRQKIDNLIIIDKTKYFLNIKEIY